MIAKKLQQFGKLEAIVLISGTVVMILELIGSRIAAPYLGTSIFIWTSLIGIILGALSLGYYIGGRASAKNPHIGFLANTLISAGLLIALIPIIKDPVLAFSATLGVKTGSVFSTIILFVLPSIIMGMVSPYAIRLKVDSVEGSGSAAGGMYALSTIGSITGTFLAGFVLIPAFSTSHILFGLSAVLIVTSFLGRSFSKKQIGALVVVLALWAGSASVPSSFVYESDSEYNHIRVVDFDHPETGQELRALLLSTEFHTIIDRNSEDVYSEYLKLYRLDSLFQPRINKALTLGGGAYAGPVDFLNRHPDADMTVVEIDPDVTEVAKEYFYLREDEQLDVVHQDARIFLNNNEEKYDIIYGDAFASYYSIPFQLTTIEAIQHLYDGLTDDGVLVLNLISALEGEKATFFRSQYKTLNQVFPTIYTFTTYYSEKQDAGEPQNIILVATKEDTPRALEDLLEEASVDQVSLVDKIWRYPIETGDNIKIFTDEFAPVEFYVSKLL